MHMHYNLVNQIYTNDTRYIGSEGYFGGRVLVWFVYITLEGMLCGASFYPKQ